MKKLFTILFSIPIFALAQPNITSVNPPIGDSLIDYTFEYPIPNFPKTGQNNWDFSNLPKTRTDSIGIKYVTPASTPYPTDFPTANVCMKMNYLSFETYLYATYSPDSLYTLGIRYPFDPSSDITFTDPQVTFKFPFAYNQLQSDRYSDGVDVDSSRTKYIAWGNLKTPFSDYSNVFLVEDFYFETNTMTWEHDTYNWISMATLEPLAVFYSDDSTGEWLITPSAATSVGQEQLASKYQLDVYPNPTSNQSFVDFNLMQESEVSLQIISVDGKTSKKLLSEKLKSGSHHIPVKTHDLANGTYFIRLLINNEPIVKTLTVHN